MHDCLIDLFCDCDICSAARAEPVVTQIDTDHVQALAAAAARRDEDAAFRALYEPLETPAGDAG